MALKAYAMVVCPCSILLNVKVRVRVRVRILNVKVRVRVRILNVKVRVKVRILNVKLRDLRAHSPQVQLSFPPLLICLSILIVNLSPCDHCLIPLASVFQIKCDVHHYPCTSTISFTFADSFPFSSSKRTLLLPSTLGD